MSSILKTMAETSLTFTPPSVTWCPVMLHQGPPKNAVMLAMGSILRGRPCFWILPPPSTDWGKEQVRIKGLDTNDALLIRRLGKQAIKGKYGNLFQMYEKIMDQNPYETPMMIYPTTHYTMGGLWVDYNLMTTVPGLFAIGEANFSDHGANRLGASALMQGLADGYFILPYTIGDYLSQDIGTGKVPTTATEFGEAESQVTESIHRLINNKGSHPVDYFHKKLGTIMWEYCGINRNKKGLLIAMEEIKSVREEFRQNVIVPGTAEEYNEELAKAGRLADFLELAELYAKDALFRKESCGAHMREEFQTSDGEALRNDEDFAHVAAWEYKEESGNVQLHKEKLVYENIEVKQRSYK